MQAIEHELPAEHETKEILKRNPGMPIEKMLKSKIVSNRLKAEGYELDEVETRRMAREKDLRRLLEKLADDKPVVRTIKKKNRSHHIEKRGSDSWPRLNDRQEW